ncbi:MAG: T9SS type A sorting domain-containing protein [Patescibacteria group bacterium]
MKRFVVFLAGLFFLTSLVATGQSFVPTQGPYGKDVFSIARGTGGRIFAGAEDNLYRFRDTAWANVLVYNDLPVISNTKPMASLNGEVIVYASSRFMSYRTLYVSKDGGATWNTEFASGFPDGPPPLTCLAFNIEGQLFTGTLRRAFADTAVGGGIWRSLDTAKTWERVRDTTSGLGLDTISVYSLTVRGNTIFVGAQSGIFLSTDAGATWTHHFSDVFPGHIYSVAIDSSGDLFLSTDYNYGNGEDIYRSTDNGTTWTGMGLGAHTTVLAVHPNGTVFGGSRENLGVLRSTNNGITWDASNPAIGNTAAGVPKIASIEFGEDGSVYVGALLDGVFRSTDNGTTWKQIGIPAQTSMVAIPDTVAPPPLISKLFTESVYLDSVPSALLAVAKGYPYQSVDGVRWERFELPGFSGFVQTAIVSPGNSFMATLGGGIFRSLDGGYTWERLISFPAPTQRIYAMAMSHGNKLFASGDFAEGLYRSSDFGNTWEQVYPLVGLITSLATSPLNDSLIFAGADGVHRSTDGGTSWELTGLSGIGITSLSVDAGGMVYAGNQDGIYRSTNNGTTWEPPSAESRALRGVQGVGPTNVLSIASKHVSVFAGTETSGLYLSTDQGTGWEPINAGLTSSKIPSVTITRRGYVFAATDKGVFRSLSPIAVAEYTYALTDGWNMVSLPVRPDDSRKTSVFPSAQSKAFAYDGGYNTEDVMQRGSGYWVKHPSAGIAILGTPVERETVSVRQGWNMIGSITSPVPVATIGSIPGGLVVSNFYGWKGVSQVYDTADTIGPGKAYWVRASANGKLILAKTPAAQPFAIVIVPTDEAPPPPPGYNGKDIPKSFMLYGNYPNPWNPTTVIKFDLPENASVTLKVWNVLGQEVLKVMDHVPYEAGRYEITLHSDELPSGIYFYTLQAGNHLATKKMILLK